MVMFKVRISFRKKRVQGAGKFKHFEMRVPFGGGHTYSKRLLRMLFNLEMIKIKIKTPPRLRGLTES